MALCRNIFLVEDNADDKMRFIEAIKELNTYIKYAIAYNDKDALNKLRIAKHLPDLIFLDINPVSVNGFEFLKHVKTDKLFSQIPVIVLSTSDKVAEKAYNAEADGFILKPVSVSRLQSEIKNVSLLTKEII